MTLYLPFWLLHKPFFQSSVTEGCHRAQTAAHSTRRARRIQLALSGERSTHCAERNEEEHRPVQTPPSPAAREEEFELGVPLRKLSGNSKRLLTDT